MKLARVRVGQSFTFSEVQADKAMVPRQIHGLVLANPGPEGGVLVRVPRRYKGYWQDGEAEWSGHVLVDADPTGDA